jgi:hypothetical protein
MTSGKKLFDQWATKIDESSSTSREDEDVQRLAPVVGYTAPDLELLVRPAAYAPL